MNSPVAHSRSAFEYVKFRVWWDGSFAAISGFRFNRVALTVLVMAISPGMSVSIPATYVAHLGNGLFMMGSRTAIQVRMEDPVRGRVMGIVAILGSLFVLGGLFTGSMATVFGVQAGMLTGPLIVISAALIMLATRPMLPNLDGHPRSVE